MKAFKFRSNTRTLVLVLLGLFSIIQSIAQKPTDPALIPKYEEAEKLYWAADSLYKAGTAESMRLAIDKYLRAVSLYREAGSGNFVAIALSDIGRVYDDLGERPKAIEFYAQAAQISRTIGDKIGEASSLNNIGRDYEDLGANQKAFEYFSQALPIWKLVGNKVGEEATLNNIGRVYVELGEKQKALDSHSQAAQIAKLIGDKAGEAASLNYMGVVYYRVGEVQKALEYFGQSLQISILADDKIGKAKTLNNIGKIYDDLGEKRKALDHYSQALPIWKLVGSKSGEATTLVSIGKTYGDLGEKQKGLSYFALALPLYRSAGDKIGEAIALNDIGQAFEELGEMQKALEYFALAMPLWKSADFKSGEATTQNNIGLVYDTLGETEKAISCYEMALTLYKFMGDKNGEATTLNNIGDVYSDVGEKQKALEYYSQALPIWKSIGNKLGETRTLNNIGLAYRDLGKTQTALDHFVQALQNSRWTGDKSVEAAALNNIAGVYLALGQKPKAIKNYSAALALWKATSEKRGEAIALENLMYLWRDMKTPSLAILYGKQSVNKYQELRGSIQGLEKGTQQTYLKSIEPTYRMLADILIAEGLFLEAQAVLDLLKEEEFGKLATRGGVPLFTLPYSSAEEAAIKAVDKVASFSRELSELNAKENPTAVDKKRILEIQMVEIPAANRAMENALASLRRAAPKIENLLAQKRKENVQSILPELGQNVVAIYTVVGDSEDKKANQKQIGWTMVVFPNGTTKAYPIDTTTLNQTVFDFRLALQGPNCDPENAKCEIKKLGQELYRKLFLQVSPKLHKTLAADLDEYFKNQKDKILMWSLDGVLRYIPMAALHDGNGFLVEKYTNVLFNTASLGSLKDVSTHNWKALGLGVSEAASVPLPGGKTAEFAPLEQVEEELKSLIQENKPEDKEGIFPGVLKLNKEFDKKALFEGMLDKPSLVHISSHFAFNPFNEEMSFLLLGNNGKLEIKELEPYPTLFAGVDLLSLSACDTASGSSSSPISLKNNANGKEMEGLAYVAQRKGAKSVMASLWVVSDRGTKELMLKFYELRKSHPEFTKGEALRQAQLALLKGDHDPKGPALNNPYYWAPFVLIGNWR